MVCGKELVYGTDISRVRCEFCKEDFETNVTCKDGHYVCDGCHRLDAMDLIEKYTIESRSKDPIEMALVLMRNPSVKMHGPEHHFLVPAVLLSAYYNAMDDQAVKAKKVKEARRRSKQILGGFCGYYGDCGAAVGTGIFMSLITDSTPLSEKGWRLSNLITAQALTSIAEHGGPRCCKRNSFLAITHAVRFLKEHMDVELVLDEGLVCEFDHLNKECLGSECPFNQ
jgi:hypothetical protein